MDTQRVEFTIEEVEDILRRMKLNGAAFLSIEAEYQNEDYYYSGITSFTIYECDSKGRYLDTFKSIRFDD